MIMITIIIAVVVAAAVVGLLFVKGNKKSHTSRTSGETIAQAVVTNINSSLKDVSKSVRTTENIRKDLLYKLDKAEANLREIFKKDIETLIKAQEIQKNLKNNGIKRRHEIMDQLRKEDDENRRRSLAKQIVETDKIVKRAEEAYDKMEDNIFDAQNNFSRISLQIQEKRAFICTPSIVDGFVLEDVERLEAEIKDRFIEIKADKAIKEMTSQGTRNSEADITEDEINKVLSSCQMKDREQPF